MHAARALARSRPLAFTRSSSVGLGGLLLNDAWMELFTNYALELYLRNTFFIRDIRVHSSIRGSFFQPLSAAFFRYHRWFFQFGRRRWPSPNEAADLC